MILGYFGVAGYVIAVAVMSKNLHMPNVKVMQLVSSPFIEPLSFQCHILEFCISFASDSCLI